MSVSSDQETDQGEVGGVLLHGPVGCGRGDPLEGFASRPEQLLHIGRGVLDGEGVDVDPFPGQHVRQLAEFPGDVLKKKLYLRSYHVQPLRASVCTP